MRILSLEIKIDVPWVHSLKEKRMEVKSLTQRVRNRFNVSVAEVAEQDTHQTIVIGIAAVCAGSAQADSVAGNILRFLDGNTQGDVCVIDRQLL